jgi:hypothetical protein
VSLYDFADTVDWQGSAFDTTGDWVLGSDVPAAGTNGPGVAYNDLEAADLAREICARLTLAPAAGALYLYPNTSFAYTPAGDGVFTFQYQLYVNRVAIGSPQTVTLNIGIGAGTAAGALLTGGAAMIAGGASGNSSVNASAPGAVLVGTGVLAPGLATGGDGPASAVAPGCALLGTAEVIAGAAIDTQFARAPVGDGYRPRRFSNQTRPDDIQE